MMMELQPREKSTSWVITIITWLRSPQSKNESQCEVMGEAMNKEERYPPSHPLKTQPMDNHHSEVIEEFLLVEDHVKLIFEVIGEVADLNFKVEQLNHKVTQMSGLCSFLAQQRHA